jgi:nucleoside-diphosphate-sugar epimerase
VLTTLPVGPPPGILTNNYETQVKTMIRAALEMRKAVILGSGSGMWSRIHIRDVGSLFFTLVEHILHNSSSSIPSGKTGYYFAENGFQSFKSIAQRIAQTGKALGVLDTDEVMSMGLQEFAEKFYEGDVRMAESILASK